MYHHHGHCHMKGFLTFLILWLISKDKMTGAEIALELATSAGKHPHDQVCAG